MKAGAGPEAAAANAKSLRKQLKRHHSCRPIPPHTDTTTTWLHTSLTLPPPQHTHLFCSPSRGFDERHAHGLGVLSFSRQNQSRRRGGREGPGRCLPIRAEAQRLSWRRNTNYGIIMKTAGRETPKS